MQFSRWQQVKRFAVAVAAIGLTVGAAGQARAGVVFSDNFNNGVDFGTSNPYWLNNSNCDGYVVTTTNSPAIFPGFPGYFDQNSPYNSPYYIEGPAPGQHISYSMERTGRLRRGRSTSAIRPSPSQPTRITPSAST